MRNFIRSLFLAQAPTMDARTHEQTFEQSWAAYQRKDYRTAFPGFKKLAEQGYANVQFNLGLMYLNGLGIPKDYQQAAAWFREAAEQGNALAQNNMGLMYEGDRGVPKDEQQAAAWYRKAAEQGYVEAQYNLGMLYGKGVGIPQDYQEAYFWSLLASAQGLQNAIKLRDIVERELSPEQRAAAQADARNWKLK
jgi:hypothetical protein